MKSFWALPVALRLVLANHATFSVLDDILAFPQYEVGIAHSIISESEASSKVAALAAAQSSSAAAAQEATSTLSEVSGVDPTNHGQASEQYGDSSGAEEGIRAYETLTLRNQKYLCSIPFAAPNNASAEAGPTPEEKEKELIRATSRGEELLKGMQGHCIYFHTGWWTYSFCYNQSVRQFHSLPPSRHFPMHPPQEDSNVQAYVLGSFADSGLEKPSKEKRKGITAGEDDVVDDVKEGERPADKAGEKDKDWKKETGLARLEQRGELKYLVQNLAGGTVCDLTGRERRIEVQFHCVPNSVDRIALIKELATCTYLMVIHTARLCSDVAFHPPQKDRPNPIRCTAVLPDNANTRDYPGLAHTIDEHEIFDEFIGEENPIIIGDIEFGANRLLGPQSPNAISDSKDSNAPPGGWLRDRPSLADSLILGGHREKLVATVASSSKPAFPAEELRKKGVRDSEMKEINGFRKQMEKMSEGKDWHLDIVETARGREFRGVIESDEDELLKEMDRAGNTAKKAIDDLKKSDGEGQNKESEAEKAEQVERAREKERGKDRDEGEGSEERYYDEL